MRQISAALRSSLNLIVFAVLCMACASAFAGAGKPIIAVFNIEDKGVGLDKEMVNRLTDYLTSSLAATGVYQVIPRSQIKLRLGEQKKDSYQACYDQTCQLEIGKELAAQKSLSTQVIKLGSKCMVTAVLYDLRKATSESGARSEGGCGEDAIVRSIQTAINELVPRTSEAAPARGPNPVAPTRVASLASSEEMVTVDFDSTPRGAEVFVNGRSLGKTPFRTELGRGRSISTIYEKHGYQPIKKVFVVEERSTFHETLTLTEEGKRIIAQRTEWFALEPIVGFSAIGPMAGASIGLFTLKWDSLSWTLLETGGGAGSDGEFFHFGTVPGYPIYLGAEKKHQLHMSLGLSFLMLDHHENVDRVYDAGSNLVSSPGARVTCSAFALVPGINYFYQSSGRTVFGGGVHVFLPVAGSLDNIRTDYFYRYPFFATIVLSLGWSSSID